MVFDQQPRPLNPGISSPPCRQRRPPSPALVGAGTTGFLGIAWIVHSRDDAHRRIELTCGKADHQILAVVTGYRKYAAATLHIGT
jgi:hypothetical protein